MYNSFSALPGIPYNIITHLALSKDAENLWKMLKYNEYNALEQPDLTFEEKMQLVWKEGPQENFGVFLTNVIGDVIPEAKCVLKCYQYYTHATNLYYGTVVYAFDFLYGVQMPLVNYNGIPVSRGDLCFNILSTVLNGADVAGIGKLTFFEDMSRYDFERSVIGNSKTFTGIQAFYSVLVGDAGINYGCDE